MTAVASGRTRPRSDVVLWDNANIVESFPEITLPLTFSIAVELYASVYRGLCLTVGVPASTVAREAPTFEHLLGTLQGRVYYNVNNWYRVLSLLPGFGLAAGFLEAMMGAARPGAGADEHAVLAIAPPPSRRLEVAMTLRLAYRMLRLGRDASGFRARLAAILAGHRRAPGVRSAASGPAAGSPTGDGSAGGAAAARGLLAEFERLRADALGDWRPPILNDLFLMFVHGALRRTAGRWLGAEAPALVNALLADGGVSARSGEELLRLRAAIRARAEWSAVVRETPPDDLRERLAREPSLAGLGSRIDAYLDAWADRAPRELQLERPTYREDPAALLRALVPLVDASRATTAGAGGAARQAVRERLLRRSLGRLRLGVFSILLRLTRRHIRWREEMRLIRGQVFGVGRRIFRELGAVLVVDDVIDAPTDIHYLTISEVRGVVNGTAPRGRARELVAERRARYTGYATLPRLPNRLETRGPASDPLTIVEPTPCARRATTGGWHGLGAAVGRVRARCLVVVEPTAVESASGRIVVARSTDPGWVPILVGAAGLVVEQGSLLSHSAIVARELGIPTVVGVAGLLDEVRDDDVLELDGTTGDVRLVSSATG